MSDYIKAVAALLHLVKTMQFSRFILLILVPVIIAVVWKLPEIILALK